MISINRTFLLCEFMYSVFNTPPNVLKVFGLHKVHHLCKTRKAICIEIRADFKEVLLKVSNKLVDFIFRNLLVDRVLGWFIAH